ncbi:MAG: succinate dehydrogenase cytochrome b subunit [Gemmatimonadota bacterium]|nr:succinate dehydrogenase cytochrome b subunit [Gemmatimonadota bacterium]MDH3368627.1 succinate dehydrogenase cytochrome b subunit [Gemmatimonadota bacterium]MDH3477949.1 succinate dehydrogenase cytochrome b subunit [Gemmatimonadota bacterium]MDH3571714.1 succinate dehydrogenase cytochrome b subunit [Gemmatimonadota bacterium]MDH5549401.1 succinate dehydrogenase cytochrome b subunit [Gemmatimonadota bacterium]
MRRVLSLYRSSVGKKILMAVTGVVFVLFVFAHMFGNLKAFYGPEKFNHYAEFLRDVGAPAFGHGQLLWLFRVVLLFAVVIHALAAFQLWRMSAVARPVPYARGLQPEESTYASRTMRWGGVILLAFVVYHLLHFTTGTAHPDFVPGAAYENLVIGFQSIPVVIAYLVAMGALCLHLYHGVWSGLQTLGVNHQRYNRYRRPLAVLVAGIVFIGFVSVPVAIAAGIIV